MCEMCEERQGTVGIEGGAVSAIPAPPSRRRVGGEPLTRLPPGRAGRQKEVHKIPQHSLPMEVQTHSYISKSLSLYLPVLLQATQATLSTQIKCADV